jgi:hypothetical protein
LAWPSLLAAGLLALSALAAPASAHWEPNGARHEKIRTQVYVTGVATTNDMDDGGGETEVMGKVSMIQRDGHGGYANRNVVLAYDYNWDDYEGDLEPVHVPLWSHDECDPMSPVEASIYAYEDSGDRMGHMRIPFDHEGYYEGYTTGGIDSDVYLEFEVILTALGGFCPEQYAYACLPADAVDSLSVDQPDSLLGAPADTLGEAQDCAQDCTAGAPSDCADVQAGCFASVDNVLGCGLPGDCIAWSVGVDDPALPVHPVHEVDVCAGTSPSIGLT